MAEKLPENNVKYITGVIKSLKEKISDARELDAKLNDDELRENYDQISKEISDLSGYLDNIRFTHGHEIEAYANELIGVSVDLGNLYKRLLPSESNLEIEVDSSGTSHGDSYPIGEVAESNSDEPEEPNKTGRGDSTTGSEKSTPAEKPVEVYENPFGSGEIKSEIDNSNEYSNSKGVFSWFKRNPIKSKILGLGLAVAIAFYSIKSCYGEGSSNKPKVKSENTQTSEKEDQPKTPMTEFNCRYDGQFALDSTKIVKGRKGLEQVIKHWPKNAPIYITTSSSVDGEEDYNLILSQDRAKTIKNIVSIDKESNIKDNQGIGETDQFSKYHSPNRRFVVSTKPLNNDKLSENAPAIGQATDGCGVTIEPEPYNTKGGKHKKHGKDTPDINLIPEPDEPTNDGGNNQPPLQEPGDKPINPAEKHTFNYSFDWDKSLPKDDGKNTGNFTGDGKNGQTPTILTEDIEGWSSNAIEGEVPTVDYTHDNKFVADDNGEFIVLEKNKELQNINLRKTSSDTIKENVIKDSYIGEKPIKNLKDKDKNGNDIDYKGKIRINVEPQSLNLENNTTLLGALIDYIVPSADAAMIDDHTYAEIKERDVDIKEKKDEVKKETGLEKMIKQNLVADVSYLTSNFNRKVLINEGSETVEFNGNTDGMAAVLGYKTDDFNVHALVQSTKTKAKVKTEAFDGDYEEEAVGIGGGLEFNLGHKRKTNVKLDAIFENRKAKQAYELVDVSTEVKTDNTIIDFEIENKNLFIDGDNYDLGLRLKGLQEFSSIKQEVTAAIPPQDKLSKDVQYSDYQGGIVFDINRGKLNMKTTVDYVLMQRPDLSSDSILNGQSLLSRIEIGKNTKLIAFGEVPLGGDILRTDYGIMIGQERFRIGDMNIKLPGWAVHFLSSNEELLTEMKTTKKNSNSVMFELKWNFDDDLFNFWNRTLQFN